MGKETIIHTNHQPLQYFHSQTKLNQSMHFEWMGFLQQFHLIIKYKFGIHIRVADMLSRPPTINAYTILQQSPMTHDNYIEQYAKD